MKKILGGILAVAIILTGIFGNVNMTWAANTADPAQLHVEYGYDIVDQQPTETKTPTRITKWEFDPNTVEQIMTFEINVEIEDELSENEKYDFKIKLESCTPDVVEIVGQNEYEWTIDKDSYFDWNYRVYAPVTVKVHKAGIAYFRVTDLNHTDLYKEKDSFDGVLLVTSPGFSQTEINLNGNGSKELAIYDKTILGGNYTFRSLNPNIATVTEKVTTTNPILNVTPVANGTTYIISGKPSDNYWVVCKVTITGMEKDAEELSWEAYPEEGEKSGFTLGVDGYNLQTRNQQITYGGNRGIFLNRITDAVDPDDFKIGLSYKRNNTTNTPMGIGELLKGTETNLSDMDEILFPYIKVYKKAADSQISGGVYKNLNEALLGEEVASFADGTMYYNEETDRICVKQGVLDDGQDYVFAISPEITFIPNNAVFESYSYFYFTTLGSKEVFPSRVAKLQETPFSYTAAYAELLKEVADTYNNISAADKQDPAVVASYNVYVGYQKIYDLFTAIQKLGSSTVTINTIKDIQAVMQAYNELTGSTSPYKNLITSELKVLLDEQMKTVDTVKAKYSVQTITVQQDKFTLNYSPNATVTIKATSDRNGALSYVSSNTGVATVDSKGVVTVKGVGTATITVKAAGSGTDFAAATKAVTVTVNKGTQTITIKPGSVASTFKLNASVVSGGGKLTYSSSKTSIATVDANGNVTVKGAGTVTFTVKAAESALYKAAQKTVTMDITAVKGKTYTVGNLKYKVTNAKTNGNGTVTVTGVSTKKATVTIGTTVKIGNHSYKVTAIGASAFKNNKKVTTVTIGANVKTIGTSAFYGCTVLKKVTFGKGVTSIGSKAFYGDKKLTTVTLGANVKTIGSSAFYQCTTLKQITFGKSVTSIGSKAFYGDKKLTTVTLGTNVKTIGTSAFCGCTTLKQITLGKSVTSIGSKAFYGDKKLAKIIIKSSSLKTVGSKAFKGIKSNAVIDVPNKKVKAYKKLMKGKGQGSKVTIK